MIRYFLLIVSIITAGYALVQVPTIDSTDDYPDYYAVQLPFYTTCQIDELPNERNPIKWWLACFSFKVLDNDKLLPYIAAVAHVPAVALLGVRWSGRPAVGVLACVAFIANPYFYLFDDSAVYDSWWSLFLLLSILLLYTKPAFSPIAFLLSVASKVYTVAFLPMYIYTIASSPIKGKRWLLLVVMFLSAAAFLITQELGVGSTVGFYPERLEDGLINLWGNLWIVAPYLTIFIVIDYLTKDNHPSKKQAWVWMLGIIISIPLLHLFTEHQTMFAYRLLPFAAFMSVYIGMVIVQALSRLPPHFSLNKVIKSSD